MKLFRYSVQSVMGATEIFRSPELISWYIDTFDTISKWQRRKQSHLEFLERHALGRMNALHLTAAALINHVRARRAAGLRAGRRSHWRPVTRRAAGPLAPYAGENSRTSVLATASANISTPAPGRRAPTLNARRNSCAPGSPAYKPCM